MTSIQTMYEITEDEQRQLDKLLRKHRKKLLAYPNVHNVDVGFEFSNGQPTGRLAIRVHVTEKLAKSDLKRKDQVPDELDGVPVDVIQFNPRPQLDRNQRHEPLLGGIQIMNVNTPLAGTSGEMSLPGDSGSVWMELISNRVVGLHFAGEGPTDPDERATAMHIHPVLNALDVLVCTDAAIGAAFIGSHCRVLAKTRAGAPCNLQVVYPSGRRSTAKGLGAKAADGEGWVEWKWMIGTHTKRVGAGTGAPLGRPLTATVTLDGVARELTQVLEGTTHTD